jgi:hypothetical protein
VLVAPVVVVSVAGEVVPLVVVVVADSVPVGVVTVTVSVDVPLPVEPPSVPVEELEPPHAETTTPVDKRRIQLVFFMFSPLGQDR